MPAKDSPAQAKNCFPALNRRRLLGGALAALPATSAFAQFRVEISGVGASQLPIAIGDFRTETLAGQPLGSIIRADLERSGEFRIVPAAGVALDETAYPDFNAWRGRAADALAGGSATKLADGRVDIRFKLWDVVKGQELGGLQQAVAPEDARRAAHKIADAIYEKLTGQKGVFSTRMAYVTKLGSRYSLRITDADGEGGQVALISPAPIISPAWSPDGNSLAYVSFETHKAVVWVQELLTGRRRVLADFRGSNSAPTFSPDGSQLALTLSRDGGSQLFLINRDGSGVRRITRDTSIDTEAVFAPDGAKLYFVSDRGGGPQVYRMPVGGGTAERVTFDGGYNISPTLSADGRSMAYITREGANGFRLCVMDLASGQVQRITDTTADEKPSFAPNGRMIVYATREGGRGVLATTTLDGKIKAKLVSTDGDVREPTWGPFLR
ncbi:MAG: Tol-Pal system protein TolB [Pelomonas sp.]|nr:Tol-Pal system protein TolB [Roseateles sp.]